VQATRVYPLKGNERSLAKKGPGAACVTIAAGHLMALAQ
jgi:hypothetical protein